MNQLRSATYEVIARLALHQAAKDDLDEYDLEAVGVTTGYGAEEVEIIGETYQKDISRIASDLKRSAMNKAQLLTKGG